jgi:membrane protein
MSSVQNVMPNDAYNVINSTIQDIVKHQHRKLLSIGVLLTIFYSTKGVASLMTSFDKAYPSFKKRKYHHQIWVSVKITLLLFLLLILSVFLIIAGGFIIKWIMHLLHFTHHAIYYFLNIIKWLIIISLFYISISLIYFYGPAVHRRWRFFSAGSTLAAFLSMLTSVAFSYFINNFGQYNKIYGSIGTLIVIMVWLYYNSMILIIGFELNASIDINKHNKLHLHS